MNNSNNSTDRELPSSDKLINSTLIALFTSLMLLVSIVLPAEYGIDPTGIGGLIGVKTTNEIEAPVSTNASISTNGTVGDERTTEFTNMPKDVATILVPAGAGLEYKFKMNKDDRLIYEWAVDKEEIYFDFHGEPEGDTSGFYESYTDSTARSSLGTFTAPFTGSHGWYFRNESDTDLNVTLATKGTYIITGIK
tara:strand:- start:44650 stop:45231 length:582 start_codon:yes stop_codon:yes gene_type:complete